MHGAFPGFLVSGVRPSRHSVRLLPIARHLRFVLARDLQKVRRPLPLEVPPAVVQRQTLVRAVLPRGLLVRERIRPLALLLRLLHVLRGHRLHRHRVCGRYGGAGLDERARHLCLLQVHLQLLVLHLRLLAHVRRKRWVVEHDRDLLNLRLQLWDARRDELRDVEVCAGLLIPIVLLILALLAGALWLLCILSVERSTKRWTLTFSPAADGVEPLVLVSSCTSFLLFSISLSM